MTRRVAGVGLKMYLGPERTRRWLTQVADLGRELTAGGDPLDLFVLPTFLSIGDAERLLAGTGVAHGAQDAFWESDGPYTGEVSAPMLAEAGCRYVEVGHAERRRLFGEDDATVARKTAAIAGAGLVPVVCVGEEDDTDPVRAYDACAPQVEAALAALPAGAEALVAYEPVWAIGAAAPAAPERVVDVVARLRSLVGSSAPPGPSGRSRPVRWIYGGSAGPGTFARLAPVLDGLFLGRSAHDVDALRRVLHEIADAPSSPAN